MQPLTTKELDYLTDSMSNEDLLIKQCVAAATQATNPAVRNTCMQLAQRHQQHYQTLMQTIVSHTQLAPTTQMQ